MSDRWDRLGGWLTEWLAAGGDERARMREQFALEHPELADEADALASAAERMEAGFLETPALALSAKDLAATEAMLASGAMAGPYRIISFLARGGMGDVYRATDVRLHRDVALKFLAPARTTDARRVERFLHEARMTASLDHPNIVRIFDVGRLGDRAYLVAELLEGETLRARISRGAMPAAEVRTIGIEIARGLAAAHAAGLVHRDLKPENIFVTRAGATKLLDFGIAKLTQDDATRDVAAPETMTGVVVGTAGYLSPEQIRGESVDGRADLFALGTVLFEMLAGTRAFGGAVLVDTLHAILHDAPSSALSRRPNVPPRLAAIVMRLLDKAPEARFQKANEVIAALESVVVESRAGAHPALEAKPHREAAVTGRTMPRRRLAAGTAITLAVLVAAAFAAARYLRPASTPGATAPQMTVAVVPFSTRPAPAGEDLLQLGLTEVFISRLGQIPEVRVLPLSATARLAPGDDFESRARDLGATHVLSGTLQRDGHRVRATVRFVSTSDSRTVWSTPVDADSSSVFTVQDIIVTRVIEQLAPGLEASARRRLAHPGTRNSDAFDAYLRGRAFVLRPTRTELTRAADAFRTAVRLDPSFADAWAGLATACKRLPLFDVPPVEGFTEAKRAADRALELQVDHPEALAALAAVAFWFEWNYPRAEQLLKRALELQPSSADSLVMLGHLFSNIGRHDEALAEIRRARALDPSWSVPRSLESQFLFMARRYDDALARATEIVTLDPQFTAGRIMRIYPLLALGRNQEAHREGDEVLRLQQQLGAARPVSFVLMLQGYAMARMGRRTEAERLLERMRAQALQQYVPPHHEALLLHALGRHDEAIDRLRAGVDGRDLFLTFVAVDSKWDGLRDSPSFRALLARVNLLDVSDRARR